MCLLVVDTALGLAALLLGVALVELGLRGDGRPWHGGAVTAADMASSSLRKNQEKDLDRAALVAFVSACRACWRSALPYRQRREMKGAAHHQHVDHVPASVLVMLLKI